MTKKPIAILAFVGSAACADSEGTTPTDAGVVADVGTGAAEDAVTGADLAGDPGSGGSVDARPSAMSFEDQRSRAFWERRWVGSAGGVTVEFNINSFMFFDSNNTANLHGYVSALPCLEKVPMVLSSVAFGNDFRPVKFPELYLDSDSRVDSTQARNLLFEGLLKPSGEMEGLLDFESTGSPGVLPACSAKQVQIVFTPRD